MVIVTGAQSQLAQCFKNISPNYSYFSKSEFDVTNFNQCKGIVQKFKPSFIINCAAYTLVDKAETDSENAFLVNSEGAKNLAQLSKEFGFTLVHISTDYVTNGETPIPLTEDCLDLDPQTVYGKSKLLGERAIVEVAQKYFIVRTSWLYSEYGNNFVKSISKLVKEKPSVGIRYDQVGSPTYAGDLALGINQLIQSPASYGIYHYTNWGVTSWYDFAEEIKNFWNTPCAVKPIEPEEYPTPAKRPKYSILNTKKFCKATHTEIPYWKRSLEICLKKLS